MRVLQINSVCGAGSTGKIAVQISDYLNESGIENYIAYGFGKSSRPNTFCFGNRLDAHLHSFLSRKLGWQGKMSHLTTWKLIRYMNRIKPDIVHLHNIHGHYLNFQMLFRYLKMKNCQVVWTFHDCWPITGKCVHFTEAGCEKWKTGCYECTQLASYPDSQRDRSRKAYEEKKMAFSSIPNLHIVTVSNWLKSVVESSFLRQKDISCIYNGIDFKQFGRDKGTIRDTYQLNDKFLILGVASIWNKRKGLDQFIELSKRLNQDEQIVLIGTVPKTQGVLPSNIMILPQIREQAELARWYATADVFINFSIEETFGLVAAEAMACGTPAIVMDSTACPEIVSSETGFVVTPGDIEMIKTDIDIIKGKGKDYYNVSCCEHIAKSFSLYRMQNSYYELYKGLGGEQ